MAKSRMPISVEFLNKLKAISGVEQINQFAERCGKHATNMTGYLSGTRNPGDGVLRDCVPDSCINFYSSTRSPHST